MATDRQAELDLIDKEILWIYRKNPFLTQVEVAQRVPRRLSAVKKRIHGLQESGYLRQGWILNPEKELLPCRCLVLVNICHYEILQSNLKGTDGLVAFAREAAENDSRYRRKVMIEDVYETFGTADIVFHLLGEDEEIIADFILNILASQRGVTATVTQLAFSSRIHVEREPTSTMRGRNAL
jgi:DNA-binding Lrp family transcriptional regulator